MTVNIGSKSMSEKPFPVAVTLHEQSRQLSIEYSDGQQFDLPFEFLRIHSPSAEVQGHGPGQAVLQVGKQDVIITDITPVGHYALQPQFSDGHNSGLFTWDFLCFLGQNRAQLWAEYLQKLEQAGQGRTV